MDEFTYFTYGDKKITLTNKLLSCPLDDKLYIVNVLNQEIISDTFFPIISMTEDRNNPQYPRSLHLLSSLCEDELTARKVTTVAIRDLFVQSMLEEFRNDMIKEILLNININTNDDEILFIEDSIPISFFPSKSFRVCKLIDDEEFNDTRFCLYNKKRLIFMRPNDISYFNFENILCLNLDVPEMNMKVIAKQPLIFELDEQTTRSLLNLDKAKYYAEPFNNDSRGGLRFIFNSPLLSERLTEAIKKLEIFKDFVRVNSVFRYNKFISTDSFFKKHYDSPYIDRDKNEYSLFTLVIYLVNDENHVSLKIEDKSFKFKNNQGIIFDQSKEHEGHVFDGEKIFIRSELIFNIKPRNIKPNKEIVKLFNQACYLTLKSIFYPELKSYASEMFNRAHKVTYEKSLEHFENKFYVFYHQGHAIEFLTDGTTYYFQRCKNISMKQYVRVILENYFSNSEYEVNITNVNLDNRFTYNDCRRGDIFPGNKFKSIDEIKCFIRSWFGHTCRCYVAKHCDYSCRNDAPATCQQHHGVHFEVSTTRPYSLDCRRCFRYPDDYHHHCSKCARKSKDEFNPKQCPSLVGQTDDRILTNMFSFDNFSIIGNRIYFYQKKRFHFAGLYCAHFCNRKENDKCKILSEVKVNKNNAFIDFLIDDDIIIFYLDFFNNNISLTSEMRSVVCLEDSEIIPKWFNM